MDLYLIFGIAAGVIFAAGNIPYCIDIYRGNTRPNLASWIGWFFVLLIGIAAQIAHGTSWSVLLPIGGALGDGATTLFILRYGYTKFGILDKVCLLLGILAITLWTLTSQPLIALALALAADYTVGIPTAVKLYKKPGTESSIGWSMFTLGSIVGLGATQVYDFNNLAYPVGLAILNGGIFLLTLRRPRLAEL